MNPYSLINPETLTDEATGMTPLEEPTPEDSLLAMKWTFGTQGEVSWDGFEGSGDSDGDDSAVVHYLSFRGIGVDEEGVASVRQVHIAMPWGAIGAMVDQLTQLLAELDPASAEGADDTLFDPES